MSNTQTQPVILSSEVDFESSTTSVGFSFKYKEFAEKLSNGNITWPDSNSLLTDSHSTFIDRMEMKPDVLVHTIAGLKKISSEIASHYYDLVEGASTETSLKAASGMIEEYVGEIKIVQKHVFEEDAKKTLTVYDKDLKCINQDASAALGDYFKGVKLSMRLEEMYDDKVSKVNVKNLSKRKSFLNAYMDSVKTSSISSVKKHVPEIDETFKLERPEVKNVVKLMSQKGFQKILLSGDSGTGKSRSIEQIYAKLKMPIIRIDFSGEILSEEFLWATNYNPETKKLELEKGILPWAVKNGVAVVFEEFSAIPPNVAFVIQRFMEKGELYIKDNDELIKPHPSFKLFMTDNRIGNQNFQNYLGTNQQNMSLIDRIDSCVYFDYPSRSFEKDMLQTAYPHLQKVEIKSRSGVTKPFLDVVLDFANSVRGSYKTGDMPISFSTRSVRKFIENYELIGDVHEALTLSLLNFVSNDTAYRNLVDLIEAFFAEKNNKQGEKFVDFDYKTLNTK